MPSSEDITLLIRIYLRLLGYTAVNGCLGKLNVTNFDFDSVWHLHSAGIDQEGEGKGGLVSSGL